ncbi:hypothetical protein WA158_002769 [Blastocystis sp. Blastoise]
MLIDSNRFSTYYTKIIKNGLNSDSSILIFVSSVCDSLCACRILTSLLRVDNIAYKIKQVMGYEDIKHANDTIIKDNMDLRSVIFLNCGGSVDLSSVLTLSEDTICYVIDSHRPISIENIRSPKQIIVINDGSILLDDVPELLTDEQQELLEQHSDDEDDGQDEEDEEEEYDDDGEEHDENASTHQTKRKHQTEKGKSLKKKRDIDHYYEYSYYAYPIAPTFYSLSRQISYDTNEMLWMAIIGLTDTFINGRLNREAYDSILISLQGDIIAKNVSTNDHENDMDLSIGYISPSEEPQLMLYRHWSLFNSFYYSSYVASKLGTWNSQGASELYSLFAKMGIPLKKCKEQFTFFNKKSKNDLYYLLSSNLEDYGFDNFYYHSYCRRYDYKMLLCASDIVYCISALLEMRSLNKDDSSWELNWNNAYDALLCKTNESILTKGIHYAQIQQESIVRFGISIIEKRLIHISEHFRYAIVNDITEEDVEMFTKPLILNRLTSFIINVFKNQGKWTGRSALPFILCILNSNTNTYTVLGVPCSQWGETKLNQFTHFFKLAIDSIKPRNKLDSFSGTIIEIYKDDLLYFIDELHTQLTQHYINATLNE